MDTRSKDGEHQKAIIANCDLITTRGAAGGAFAGRRVSAARKSALAGRFPKPWKRRVARAARRLFSLITSVTSVRRLRQRFRETMMHICRQSSLHLAVPSSRTTPWLCPCCQSARFQLARRGCCPRFTSRSCSATPARDGHSGERASAFNMLPLTAAATGIFIRCRRPAPRGQRRRAWEPASDQVSAFLGNSDFSSATNKARHPWGGWRRPRG